ncbi:MAG: hypothetical protein JXR96_16690 [Deltaproteobacteria bacterium]|nr:hypothetical protein [Deltaproteobacteria bacterium]
MKKTPLQKVTEAFGGKDKLVDQLLGMIKRPAGDSKEDFRRKLRAQSNRKLMILLEREQQVKERFGGRDKLIEALLNARMGKAKKPDEGYRKHLEKRTNGQLLDLARRQKT